MVPNPLEFKAAAPRADAVGVRATTSHWLSGSTLTRKTDGENGPGLVG